MKARGIQLDPVVSSSFGAVVSIAFATFIDFYKTPVYLTKYEKAKLEHVEFYTIQGVICMLFSSLQTNSKTKLNSICTYNTSVPEGKFMAGQMISLRTDNVNFSVDIHLFSGIMAKNGYDGFLAIGGKETHQFINLSLVKMEGIAAGFVGSGVGEICSTSFFNLINCSATEYVFAFGDRTDNIAFGEMANIQKNSATSMVRCYSGKVTLKKVFFRDNNAESCISWNSQKNVELIDGIYSDDAPFFNQILDQQIPTLNLVQNFEGDPFTLDCLKECKEAGAIVTAKLFRKKKTRFLKAFLPFCHYY